MHLKIILKKKKNVSVFFLDTRYIQYIIYIMKIMFKRGWSFPPIPIKRTATSNFKSLK